MFKKEKLKEISNNLIANRVEYVSAFRHNVLSYVADKDITLTDIARESGIPINTLNTFIYGKSNDTRISNVVRLAHTLDVSMDELVGAETIPELTRESLKMSRNLPENDLKLVRWFIRYLAELNSQNEPNKRYVSVMMPKMDNNGDFEVTADYEKIEITDLKEPLKSKIFMGFHIICDHYMPHYGNGNIILIANDRPPKPNEHAVARVGKYLFIVRRVVENGTAKYYSIRDGKYRINESEISELMGYIAAKI